MSSMTSTRPLSSSATLKRVAEVAGVSTATVARVLNDDPRVAEATRSRVVVALQATGYRPNAIASGLRRQRTSTVGHIVNATSPNPFYIGVAVGLQQEAARHGYQVILQNSQDVRDRDGRGRGSAVASSGRNCVHHRAERGKRCRGGGCRCAVDPGGTPRVTRCACSHCRQLRGRTTGCRPSDQPWSHRHRLHRGRSGFTQ